MKRTRHNYRLTDKEPLLSALRVALQQCDSRYKIWQATGVPQAWMSQFVNGKQAHIRVENVEKLMIYFGIRSDDVFELMTDPEEV